MSDRQGFDRIIGQNLAGRILLNAIKRGQPAPSYLFVGLQGTGKFTVAKEFAQALNCESPTATGACGLCANCRAVEHGNSADVNVWSPGSVKNTTIEQMREMRSLANFAPARSRWRINIIEQGDTLNAEAASCILKLIEEPPSYLINILLYRNAAAVLPTIRSRCQVVRFTQVEAELLAHRLVEDFGIDADQADFLASYSQGRPGIAIGLIGNEDFFHRRGQIISIADQAASGSPWVALRLAEALRSSTYAESAADDDEAPEDDSSAGAAAAQQSRRVGVREITLESLDMLQSWYRDLLAARLSGQDARIVNSDRREEVFDQSSRYPHSAPLMAALESIQQAKRAIAGNANPQIALEAMMMKFTV